MPVKAPPPSAPAVAEETYGLYGLLALAAIAGLICLGVCRSEGQPVPISPNWFHGIGRSR